MLVVQFALMAIIKIQLKLQVAIFISYLMTRIRSAGCRRLGSHWRWYSGTYKTINSCQSVR